MKIARLAVERRSLALVLSLFFETAASAAPRHYDIQFPAGAGGPSSGAFLYDDALQVFTQFVIVWNGESIDVRGSANFPVTQGPCPPFTGAEVFQVLISGGQCAGLPLIPAWMTFPPNPQGGVFHSSFLLTFFNSNSNGPLIGGQHPDPGYIASFSSGPFAVTAVPEPSVVTLLLLGGAVMALQRRRKVRDDCA